MESKENVKLICKDCSKEMKEKWQSENPNLLGVGTNVKLAFPYKDENNKTGYEHMWVCITEIANEKDKIYKGYLNNDPIFVDASYKDIIEFSHDEIEDSGVITA